MSDLVEMPVKVKVLENLVTIFHFTERLGWVFVLCILSYQLIFGVKINSFEWIKNVTFKDLTSFLVDQSDQNLFNWILFTDLLKQAHLYIFKTWAGIYEAVSIIKFYNDQTIVVKSSQVEFICIAHFMYKTIQSALQT